MRKSRPPFIVPSADVPRRPTATRTATRTWRPRARAPDRPRGRTAPHRIHLVEGARRAGAPPIRHAESAEEEFV